jgi:uncharacterized membrane protein
MSKSEKAAALILLGFLLFDVTHKGITAQRGYNAIGGEGAFIILPLAVWLFVRIIKDFRKR